MSNTNDPKKPTPASQPTPKPGHAHREVSFEFQMPEDMDSFDGLNPVPQPDRGSMAKQRRCRPSQRLGSLS